EARRAPESAAPEMPAAALLRSLALSGMEDRPLATYPLPDSPIPGKIMTLHVRILSGTGGGADKTTLNSPHFLRHTRYAELVAYLHDPRDPAFATLRRRAAARQCPLFEVADR